MDAPMNYCTLTFNVYPNVIMNDPLLSPQQVSQLGRSLQPLRQITYSNDPKVLTSNMKVRELQASINNAQECFDWVIKNHPAYFPGMHAKVYNETTEGTKILYEASMPFDVHEAHVTAYKNDNKKTVTTLMSDIPYWCSESDRYDWVKEQIAGHFTQEPIAPYVPTKDITIVRFTTVADKENNSQLRLVELDEFLEKNGYYRCDIDEFREALKNNYKQKDAEDIYNELNNIPEPVEDEHLQDIALSFSKSDDEALFGKNDDDKIFGDDF